MASTPLSQIHELSAKVRDHLHQFMDEDEMTNGSRTEITKKKRNPIVNAALVGGGVAGAAALPSGLRKAREVTGKGVSKAASATGVAGMKVANKGIDAASKIRKMNKAGVAADVLEKGAIGGGNLLIKGARKLRRVATLFSADDVKAFARLEQIMFERGI